MITPICPGLIAHVAKIDFALNATPEPQENQLNQWFDLEWDLLSSMHVSGCSRHVNRCFTQLRLVCAHLEKLDTMKTPYNHPTSVLNDIESFTSAQEEEESTIGEAP